MAFKRELTALQKDLNRIGQKLEKLIAAIGKGEAQTAKVSKGKVIRATAKKAPAKKKITKVTATDQVLKIINKSKKGVDTATLMKKTGFNQKKITNILQRTFKAGKIKRAAKGIYVGA